MHHISVMNGCTKRRVQAPHEWENAMNICQKLLSRIMLSKSNALSTDVQFVNLTEKESDKARERECERARAFYRTA